MTISQPPIAIIGAGPSGLILARFLELAHIGYVVFERDESATWADEHSSSGTLDIHADSGQVALKEAGLLDQFRSIARYDVLTRIADGQGNVCFCGDGDKDKPEIDRKDLRRLLLESIPAGRVSWGCKVQHVRRDGDGLLSVHLTDGRVEPDFRLVVGADGAWSKVRKLVTAVEPKYSGHHFFTTFIKPGTPVHFSLATMVEQGNYLGLSKGRQIFLHYLGDGSYHLSVGMKLGADRTFESKDLLNPPALWRSVLQYEFTEWDQELTNLIKSGDADFRSWPLYSMPEKFEPWKHIPGVTLVGDAAHLTVPSGDGVNNALYDSLELARQITKHKVDNLESAVIDYEKAMIPRAVDAIEKGHWYTKFFFGADSPQSFLQATSAHCGKANTKTPQS